MPVAKRIVVPNMAPPAPPPCMPANTLGFVPRNLVAEAQEAAEQVAYAAQQSTACTAAGSVPQPPNGLAYASAIQLCKFKLNKHAFMNYEIGVPNFVI